MKPEYTFSRALDSFLRDYPNRTGLDCRLLIEVFRSGRYVFFGGATGANFSGRGIALTIGDESDMRGQLSSALSYNEAHDWPHAQTYVERTLGKKIF